MKIGIALKEIKDEDWKTQLAHKYPNIPKGAEIEIIDEDFINFYGRWYIVLYNGIRYYVDKNSIKIKEKEDETN